MIVLRYFSIVGRAQQLRHAPADACVAHEDVRIALADWPRYREDTAFAGPYRGLPTLTCDGETISETLARTSVKPDTLSHVLPAMARMTLWLATFVSVLAVSACSRTRTTAEAAPGPSGSAVPVRVGADPGHAGNGTPLTPNGGDRLAAFAAGCFWGIEDAYRRVPGVVATAVGYAGGHSTSPTYESVCTHTTGHAETVLVEYDPTRVRYEQLLRVFWKIHDPTQVGGQGPDQGDSYRSVVFTFDDEEAAAARAALQAEQNSLPRPITTQVRPMGAFYKAEDYHQQYAERTGHHGCPIGKVLETF